MSVLSLDGNALMLPVLAGLLLCGLLAAWWGVRRRKTAVLTAGQRRRRDAMEHLDTVQAWQPEATRVLPNTVLQAHKVLRMAFPEHVVLAQISLSRFLKVPTRNSYAEWMRRVGGQCVDLLVCDADSKVIAVVEIRQPADCINDKALKRQQRMDRVLEAAGIPVHVWLEGQLPSPASARNAITGSSVVFTTRTGATLVDVAPDHSAPDSQPEASTQSNAPVSAWFDSSRMGGAAVLEAATARRSAAARAA